jgi:hypothetical protein
MVKRNFVLTGIISLVLLFPVYSIEFSVENDGNTYDFDIGGYGGIIGGQIIRGLGVRGNFDHTWIENAFLGLLFDATINGNMRVILNSEFYQVFSYDMPETELGVENKMDLFWIANWIYLREVRGIYTLGDPEQFSFQVNVGKWHYKYNPEAHNLGEYLFRGNSYPTWYETKFDDPTSPLMGFLLSTNINTKIFKPQLDIMLTSETVKYPMQDWSLSGIASFKLFDFWGYGDLLGMGAGICFDRIFSKDPFYTTPSEGNPGQQNLYYADTLYDTIGIDPITLLPIIETSLANEKNYTFAGTKATFRFCLDPKVFFDWEKIFTEDDLKIYAEFAVLGFKNYPDVESPADTANFISNYYAFREDRMPRMIGINVPIFPFFHIFDVVSVELEWFNTPYIQGYEEAFKKGWPKPVEKDIKNTKFYWSVYAKKDLGPFTFVTQFARDHMRPVVLNFNYTEWNDVLVESSHWWWSVKIQFGI